MLAPSRRAVIIGVTVGVTFSSLPALSGAPSKYFIYDACLDKTGLARSAAKQAGMEIVPVESNAVEIGHLMARYPNAPQTALIGLTMPAAGFIFGHLAMRQGNPPERYGPYLWTIGPVSRTDLEMMKVAKSIQSQAAI